MIEDLQLNKTEKDNTETIETSLEKSIKQEKQKSNIKDTEKKLKEKIKKIEKKEESMRISDMADLLNIPLDELINKASSIGIEVKDHDSILSAEDINSIKKKVIF